MMFENGCFGGGANNSVQPGSVSAASGDADTAYVGHGMWFSLDHPLLPAREQYHEWL
jgi:hypothetical protein